MRKRLTKFAQVAGIMLALAFTFSCSGNDDNGGGGGSTFKDDRDGKSYKYVKIGEQVWMSENLNYAESGSCYKGDSTNCTTYGSLYKWDAAISACPSGWHLPSSEEWEILMTTVGGVSTAGTKLKSKSGWSNNGTDNYGFSALPGGRYISGVGYDGVGRDGYWW